MNDFARAVLDWFAVHGRLDLPWQVNPTPYRVWVSEIMLQQTQVATVIPYYERFMASYPDAQALADADIDNVLGHWSGLGYYARARNLHKAACVIRDEHGGEFPDRFDDVIALPGIGRSTAGAILALARDQRHAILDGNVKRVLSRYRAIAGWPGTTTVAKELWQQAESLTPSTRVAGYTQAMMDLGATVCTRTKPLCSECPLATGCEAHTTGRETEFPGRREKKKKPLKRTTMVLARAGGAVYLERRPPTGIWGGLWSFPELANADDLAEWCKSRLGAAPGSVDRWPTLRHSFTHYDLDIEPLAVTVRDRSIEDTDGRIWHELGTAARFGLAAPVAGLLARIASGSDQR